METVIVELKSNKAMKLLKDLESMDLIKIHQHERISEAKDKASKYKGSISKESADQLLKHVEEMRNEWEERFPTK